MLFLLWPTLWIISFLPQWTLIARSLSKWYLLPIRHLPPNVGWSPSFLPISPHTELLHTEPEWAVGIDVEWWHFLLKMCRLSQGVPPQNVLVSWLPPVSTPWFCPFLVCCVTTILPLCHQYFFHLCLTASCSSSMSQKGFSWAPSKLEFPGVDSPSSFCNGPTCYTFQYHVFQHSWPMSKCNARIQRLLRPQYFAPALPISQIPIGSGVPS